MLKKTWKIVTAVFFLGCLLTVQPEETQAAVSAASCQTEMQTSSSYLAKIDAPDTAIHAAASTESTVFGTAHQGKTYEVLSYENGWAKISGQHQTGYIKVAGQATIVETAREKVDPESLQREEVVRFALQFVGNPYVYGGTDPNRGADCSGFTSYVMRHAAGVSLSHSSRVQAGEGKPVSEPKPGDLVFYASGGRINHVAIYIGNGQIVHASTERTGIKTSPWQYRTPYKIVDVLS